MKKIEKEKKIMTHGHGQQQGEEFREKWHLIGEEDYLSIVLNFGFLPKCPSGSFSLLTTPDRVSVA